MTPLAPADRLIVWRTTAVKCREMEHVERWKRGRGGVQVLYAHDVAFEALDALCVQLLCVPASQLRGTCAVQKSGGTVRDDAGAFFDDTAITLAGVWRVI